MDHKARLVEVHEALKKVERNASVGLEKRWNEEKELVSKVIEIRGKLRAQALPVDDPKATKDAIDAKEGGGLPSLEAPAQAPRRQYQTAGGTLPLGEKLTKLQGENPLIFPCVDAGSVGLGSLPIGPASLPLAAWRRTRSNRCSNSPIFSSRRVIG